MANRREILSELKTFLEIESQSGRRHAHLDPEVVKNFLALSAVKAQESSSSSSRVNTGANVPAAAEPAPAPAPMIKNSNLNSNSNSNLSALEAARAAKTVAEVAAAVEACRGCELCKTVTHKVPGIGNPIEPDIMFVGEAPGAEEDEQGEPFVGRSGQLLMKMITAMGYSRETVFIANVLKCRPPENATPTPAQMKVCLPFLRKQIYLVKPKVIVALGTTAYTGLTGDDKSKISSIRGLWQTFSNGPQQQIPMMVTYHPAYLLRAPKAKAIVWEDLKAVLARLGKRAES